MNGVNNATCSEEQEGLKHGVGKEVEHRSHVTQTGVVVNHRSVFSRKTYAQRNHHKGNLRNGRERKYALDVTLYASYRCRIEGGNNTYPHYNGHRLRSVLNPEGEEACNLEYTSHNHRRSVNQRTDGSRTFHCIGQPNVKGEHRTLTCTTNKHQYEGCGEHEGTCRKTFCVEVKTERLAVVTINKDTHKEEHVGKARYDKRLLRSGNRCGGGVVEPDEEVR